MVSLSTPNHDFKKCVQIAVDQTRAHPICHGGFRFRPQCAHTPASPHEACLVGMGALNRDAHARHGCVGRVGANGGAHHDPGILSCAGQHARPHSPHSVHASTLLAPLNGHLDRSMCQCHEAVHLPNDLCTFVHLPNVSHHLLD